MVTTGKQTASHGVGWGGSPMRKLPRWLSWGSLLHKLPFHAPPTHPLLSEMRQLSHLRGSQKQDKTEQLLYFLRGLLSHLCSTCRPPAPAPQSLGKMKSSFSLHMTGAPHPSSHNRAENNAHNKALNMEKCAVWASCSVTWHQLS